MTYECVNVAQRGLSSTQVFFIARMHSYSSLLQIGARSAWKFNSRVCLTVFAAIAYFHRLIISFIMHFIKLLWWRGVRINRIAPI